MSSCVNCDCFDKSNCIKKENGYGVTIVGMERSTVETIVMEVPAAEIDGKCTCGANCSCSVLSKEGHIYVAGP